MLNHPKMKDMQSLLPIIAELKKAGKKIAFTNGCFDIIHPGHVDLLARIKCLADVLVLGLNTDNSVQRQNKAFNRPINTYEARAFLLAHLEAVDYVIAFDEDTPYELIKAIGPNVLVKGGDWPVDKIVGSDIVLENKGEVYSLPLIEGYSTTKIIEKICLNPA